MPPPRPTLACGLIGGGLMGREFASALSRWCHLTRSAVRPELVAVCSGREETLGWFRENFPGLRQATTDYRALLANPDVEAVYVAVPHLLHGEVYAAALRAGKHLLGEKPFGIDAAANAAIAAAAAERPGQVVRCVSQFPFYPGAQRIHEMARQGRLGQILEVQAGFLHSSDLDPAKPLNWKRQVATNGAYGCLGDLGLHILHLPLRLGWYPRDVRAILSKIVSRRPTRDGGTGVCDTWDNAVLLCAAGGPDGAPFPMVLRTARIAPGERNTWYLRVAGTRLSARFSTKHPRTLQTMPFQPGAEQAWRHEDLGHTPVHPTITGPIFEFGFGDAFLQMVAAFVEEVAAGSAAALPFPCASLEETRWQHALFTAALESHRRGQVEPVAPPP